MSANNSLEILQCFKTQFPIFLSYWKEYCSPNLPRLSVSEDSAVYPAALTLRKSLSSYPAPKAEVYCLEISKRPVTILCNSGIALSHSPPSSACSLGLLCLVLWRRPVCLRGDSLSLSSCSQPLACYPCALRELVGGSRLTLTRDYNLPLLVNIC